MPYRKDYPTETGRIIEKTQYSPFFSQHLINGDEIIEGLKKEEQIEIVEKWKLISMYRGRLTLKDMIDILNDFGEKKITKDVLNRIKNMGLDSKSGQMPFRMRESVVKKIGYIANFDGSSLEEYQNKDLSERSNAFYKLACRDVARHRIQKNITKHSDKIEKDFSCDLVDIIRDYILEFGASKLFSAGLEREQIIDLFMGGKPEINYLGSLVESLNIPADKLLIAIKKTYQ